MGIAKDFYDEMQIPFAGYRRYNDASLYAEGEGANLWSSSPSSASNPASRGFFLNSDGVYTYGLNDRTVAYSVRCFYDSYQPLTQSFSLSLHDESEMEIASGSVESGAVWTGVVPDLSDAKEGREFLGRYDIDDPDEKIFDLESTPITKNLILKPKFEIRQFTISFLDSD